MCRNEPKCAQCDGNHHSLDNQCQVIKEYKDQLKEDVEDAIQKGLLQRLSLQEKSPMFEFRDQDFPPLTTSDNHSNKRWNIAQPRTTVESNFLRSSDTEKAFESINDNLVKLIDLYASWGTRAVEAIDLVCEVQASVCIFTEVGELWNTCRLPHFNTFYQKGANNNGGVEGTILSGDFNATVKEWNSPITDRRGASVREWINEKQSQ
ncbi:unnamed protein product [Rotaria socialis]|uniref:Endonuclease/exonuclease/phosphatase domain-containing protein n=4 Tax=Rotaria socialis TaxID=392032 RepID=A0A820Z476_9BILA|nr:unnamed protein product [Rotaria socialis]